MTTRPLTLSVLAAALLLGGCATPPGPGEVPFNDCSLPEDYVDEACTGDDDWLQDDLDLDSYLLSGFVDGVRFSSVVCALNLDPSWVAYRDGNEGFGLQQSVLFLASDASLSGGLVEGVWDLSGEPGHFIELRNGSWTRNGAGDMKEDGSIVVSVTAREHVVEPEPGHVDRDASTTFELTAIPTSQDCVDHTNLDALRAEREELGIGPWD